MTNSTTLFVMARNEERSIRRCIDSVSAFVDAVLVLDTGSTDNTIELVRMTGAEVITTDWTDNFSEARNYGLAHVRTDYVLALDSDEWLISGASTLEGFRRRPRESAVFEIQMQMLDHDKCGPSTDTIDGNFFTPRLFPHRLRYSGRVHENLTHSLIVKRLPLVVGHDGYAPPQIAKKRGRNISLLRRSLIDDPKNPLTHYYFAKELRAELEDTKPHLETGDLAQIKQHFLASVSALSPANPNREVIFREALLFYRAYKLYDDGIRLIFTSLREQSTSRELSYLSAVFLFECALYEASLPKSLLVSTGDAFACRLTGRLDEPSKVYNFSIDMAYLERLRDAAARAS